MNTGIDKKNSPPLNILERLTYHILTVISAITALLPRRATIWLGKGLGMIIYVLIPLRKKVAIQNLNIANNHLLLFPSYLGHSVNWNASTTTIRISIAFNVFVKGNIGEYHDSSKLNLR